MQFNAVRPTIAISFGAIPGALSRYYLTEFTKDSFGEEFAYFGTFFINITGCFLIALFYTLNEERFQTIFPEFRLMFATGFCGAYTTFSTYGLETFTHLQIGNTTVAFIYWFGSAIAGMIAIQLGVIMAKLAKSNQ